MTAANPASNPRRLGAYQLLERLGVGGMGEVWRAEHVRLGRQAAVKLVNAVDSGPLSEASAVVRRRFEREARATASLTSPHTVSLYDFGVAPDGTFYYAMELLEGLDIEALVTHHGPQPPARIVHLVAQACDSLAEAHARGLLHRDIKPSNLFVCRRGLDHDFVKVLDFGLVKGIAGGVDSLPGLTGEHRRVGTPAFMPPETAREGGLPGPRADLYALGCVTYFLLTATHVFPGDDSFTLMVAHIEDAPEPPSARTHHDVPKDLEAVVMACLAKRPDDRPADALSLKAALLECAVARLWTPERAERWWREREPEALTEAPLLSHLRDPARVAPDEWANTLVDESLPGPESTLVDVESLLANNLPAEVTSFVGRATELEAMRGALARGLRLLTLHGPGGVGKSRIALRFAAQCASELPGGVWQCDLAEARSSADVCQHVADALGVLLTAGEPEDCVARALVARGPTLLVLDNVEQAHAPAGGLVARWLAVAPRLNLVATSREPLRVAGEQVVPVEPFRVPKEAERDPAALEHSDAVRLFLDRARATDPSFELTVDNAADVARLVRQLDGLPLAIELAAARIRVLSPGQVAERVANRLDVLRASNRDVPERQTTLQATLDWSWQHLSDWERAALAQAALFHGGFSLEAAEAVLDLTEWGAAPPVVEALDRLLDKSWLRSVGEPANEGGSPRFSLLSSVQSYAITRFKGATKGRGLEATAERHGRFYATYGDTSYLRSLHGNLGGERLRELSRERDNLRGALARALDREDDLSAAGSARALVALASARGPMGPAIDLARPLLDRPRLPTAERLSLLLELGAACRYAGRMDEARALLDEALSLAGRASDWGAQARATGSLATIDVEEGDYERGRRGLERALALSRKARDAYAEAQQVMRLAVMDELAGRRELAEAAFVDARGLARAIGARDIEGTVVVNLGELYLERGEIEAAHLCFTEALEAHRDVGSLRAESYSLRGLGDVELVLGRYEQAERHFREALGVARTVGVLAQESAVLTALAEIYRRCERLDLALDAGEQALELVASNRLLRDEGPTSVELAFTLIDLGELERAAALVERAAELMTADTPAVERAVLLCGQAELAAAEGDRAAGREALAIAEALSASAGVGPRSRLASHLESARQRLDAGAAS